MSEAACHITLPQADAPVVSLLIPTTSQAARLSACLASLARHLPPAVPCEVIVVLNAASAAVRDLVLTQCTGVRTAESPANLGVAGGYNLGRSLASGSFLVLLHDDVEIHPGWLESLLATAAAHPEAGAVGSRSFLPDGTPQRAGSILWRNGLTAAVPDSGEAQTDPWPVDYCGTCSLLVRTALWDAIGGMDERIYPAYYVDVDLCMGLRQHGAAVLCDPASTLLHHAGSSSAKPFAEFCCHRNREYFLTKWVAAMPQYEPWAPDDPAAARRAMERTCQMARDLRGPEPSAAPGLSAASGPDPASRTIRHFQMAATLSADWSRDQIRRLEAGAAEARAAAQTEITKLREKLAARDLKIAGLRERCETLKAKLRKSPRPTGWQRLRRWLRQGGSRPGA